jgi:5-methylcytosine-specific restriction endonuclease McrA
LRLSCAGWRASSDVWRQRVQALVGHAGKEPRCFSRALKKELYDRDPTCAICKQHIVELDDAHVDHAKHYWRGGKTIRENARLAHRYCNVARGGRS